MIYEGDDYNLSSCLQNNLQYIPGKVTSIVACIEGKHEGAYWHWIVTLDNKNFAYITGGCDYTGWDGQSGASSEEAKTIEEVLSLTPTFDNYNRNVTDELTLMCHKLLFNDKLIKEVNNENS